MTPLQLYTYQTPNGHKASIMLEETGLPYQVRLVDIEVGEQHAPAFLALNPNNKIPVIVDPDSDRVVVESGVILLYLAERAGRFVPRSLVERDAILQWLFFQAAHVGPTLGQLWNYKIFVSETLPTVIARFEKESRRVFGVLDGQLCRTAHLAGEDYGIADVMTWPWINAAVDRIGVPIDGFAHLHRWFDAIAARPAVRRGLAVPILPNHGSN